MNNTNETQFYTIYSQRLMATLVLKGFVLMGMQPNENGNGRNVFFFKNSTELQNALTEYTNNLRKRK